MKEIMVTRTVLGTRAIVLCLNTETAEPFNEEVRLAGTFKDNAKMLAAVAKQIDTEEVKAVKILDSYIEEKRYGMPLSQFMGASVELYPLPKKKVTE